MAARLTDAERHKRNTDALRALENKLKADVHEFKKSLRAEVDECIVAIHARLDKLEGKDA